jgi:hypothetical protein
MDIQQPVVEFGLFFTAKTSFMTRNRNYKTIQIQKNVLKFLTLKVSDNSMGCKRTSDKIETTQSLAFSGLPRSSKNFYITKDSLPI